MSGVRRSSVTQRDMIVRALEDLAFARVTEKKLREMERGNYVEVNFDEFLARARR